MILKKLYEDYDLAIERILIKEYRRLKLNISEMSVLISLLSIYKKRKTFSLSAISKRVELSLDEINKSLNALLEKGFMSIELENKDGKEREIFDLDLLFIKIEKLFYDDQLEKNKVESESKIIETIKRFEQGLGRTLQSYELENIRKWYDDKKYSHEKIIDAINASEDRVSIKYVERLLNQNVLEKIEIDSDVEEALDAIFKNIR
jgi:DNA replication protein